MSLDNEQRYESKVRRGGYYIMLNGKLMGANPTRDGALRTADIIGPKAVVMSRGEYRKSHEQTQRR